MEDAELAGGGLTNVPLGNDYPEIREAVRAICRKFPSEY